MLEPNEVFTPPVVEGGEKFVSNFGVESGRVIDGEIAAFFVHSGNPELDSAARSLGGDEALDFYTNSRIEGRSEADMQRAAELLKNRLNNPEVQARLIELADKKRELKRQVEALEQEYSELVVKYPE